MAGSDDPKDVLHRYLKRGREELVWKLDGLSEYDARRPMTTTGTNLLGVVKHVASVELDYFGPTFGRPHGIPLPWFADGAEPNADMWATADESRAEILELYRRCAEHSDAVIAELPLDAPGHVPWWPPERADVTLQRILVHMVVETARHAGHADIVRELIDARAGYRADSLNLGFDTDTEWAAYRQRVEDAAVQAAANAGELGR